VYPIINNVNGNPIIASTVRHFFKKPVLFVIHSVFDNAYNPNINIPQNIDHAPTGIHESKLTKLLYRSIARPGTPTCNINMDTAPINDIILAQALNLTVFLNLSFEHRNKTDAIRKKLAPNPPKNKSIAISQPKSV
jgi:hypothetical protein